MRLQIGNKVFAPSLLATVLTLLLLPAFISLGCWQLRRADAKRALMIQAAAGQSQVISLNAANADQLTRYQHVSVQGVFDGEQQVLLDNMPSSHGQPGYRVWVPLKLHDGSIVLIDRGWFANDLISRDDKKSSPAFAALKIDNQPRTVTGIIDELPRPGIRAGNAGIGTRWPQLLNYPNIDELRRLYGNSLQTRIVLMDADNPDGFERLWHINHGLEPERHIAYAIQWFGFALTLLIIYIVVNLKRKSQTQNSND
jgi:surfeit locus 1 family protein